MPFGMQDYIGVLSIPRAITSFQRPFRTAC